MNFFILLVSCSSTVRHFYKHVLIYDEDVVVNLITTRPFVINGYHHVTLCKYASVCLLLLTRFCVDVSLMHVLHIFHLNHIYPISIIELGYWIKSVVLTGIPVFVTKIFMTRTICDR